MAWDPSDYNGVKEVNLQSDKLWVPDIVLYNKYVLQFYKITWRSQITFNLYRLSTKSGKFFTKKFSLRGDVYFLFF